MGAERLDVLDLDELEHLQRGESKDTLRKRFDYLENGRVEEIVTIVV